jgi:ABC-type enterochelin transport system permease subunit
MIKDKELRGYIGAGVIFFLVMGLLLFLAFYEIPETNNDIFKVIVGMLVGSLSVVIYTFIGKNPEEVAELQAKSQSLETKVKQLVEEKDNIEALLRKLQSDVIDKLSVTGQNFTYKK